jgi:hypothetical protein
VEDGGGKYVKNLLISDNVTFAFIRVEVSNIYVLVMPKI